MDNPGQEQSEDWLCGRIISCPHYYTPLYRVNQSPFNDGRVFYCDSCANRAEVSYYDPMVFDPGAMRSRDRADLPLTPSSAAGAERQKLMEIEAKLKPCDCGGRYRHDAARRCHVCLGEVITEEPDVDLWPVCFGIDPFQRELTAEEVMQCEQFARTHIRRNDIWE